MKNWIEAGQLEAFRTPGRHFRISSSALRRFQAAFGFPADPNDSPRILVVDDQQDFLELVLDTLRELLPDARFEGAGGGYEALLRIGSFQPHLLLLDLRMPGLDGFEVCRQVKETPESKGTKILAMTGFADDQAESMVLASGADAFLSKHTGLGAIGRAVKTLLGAEAPAATARPSPTRARAATGRAKSPRPKKKARGRRL